MKKLILVLLFLLGVGYILWPGYININQFPDLYSATKSTEPYDTYLLPNTKAFFSDIRRNEVIPYYRDSLQKVYCPDNAFKTLNPFCYITPIRINRPVEEADVYIRDQMLVTYLEEYTYPLKGSLFINGFEPFDETGKQFDYRSHPILIDGVPYDSKTTIRWYQPNLIWSLVVYTLIWVSIYFLYKLTAKGLKNIK